MIMISLAFIISKEKEKDVRGGRKKKLERKSGRRRNKKISPILGPALIWPVEQGSRSWGMLPLQ